MNIKTIIFCFVLLSLLSCSQHKSYIANPEEQIVRELSQHRIVMLADFAHEFPLPFHTLTATLSTWLMMIEKGESNQNHLTLFLEAGDQVGNLLRQYLKTGDLNPWLDFILPSTTLERLEFYSDLRRITLQIDSLNRGLPTPKQITFDVQCPEEMNVFDSRMLDSSDKAATLYFVNRRDSISSLNIISYLKAHPDQKGLIFYGNGHLIKNIVTKPFTEGLASEESQGAFMAYYLKREYGDSQVFTITQVEGQRPPIDKYNFDSTDVMIPAPDVPWKNSFQDNDGMNPSNFDAFIVRTKFQTPSHPLSHIFSKRILTSSIKRMDFLDPHLQGVGALRFYHQAAQALRFLSDTNCTSIENWKSWYSSHHTFDFEQPGSAEFRKRLADQLFPQKTKDMQDLENLGFTGKFKNLPSISREDWQQIFDQMLPQVIDLNSIGIYWIGDSLEQSKAKAHLIESSGKNFDDPGLYLKWWRKKYLDVDY